MALAFGCDPKHLGLLFRRNVAGRYETIAFANEQVADIERYRYAMLFVKSLFAIAQRIVVLDAGQIIAEGTPDEIVRNPAVEKAYLGA